MLQGEWKPKQIDNPNYKGVWVHPEIDNPEYTPDAEIYKFDNIGVLGLDLWQVKRRSLAVQYPFISISDSFCCKNPINKISAPHTGKKHSLNLSFF